MKITNFIIKNITSIKQQTKTLLGNVKMRFGLQKDLFQKTPKNINNNNIIHKGDNFLHVPDSINVEGKTDNFTVDKITFFKEDINKMKHMTTEECLNYKKYLIENNRYID